MILIRTNRNSTTILSQRINIVVSLNFCSLSKYDRVNLDTNSKTGESSFVIPLEYSFTFIWCLFNLNDTWSMTASQIYVFFDNPFTPGNTLMYSCCFSNMLLDEGFI